MENRCSKLAMVLMMVALLLALAIGPVAPGVDAQAVEAPLGPVESWAALPGPSFAPVVGGGGGTGGV
jgi:hypothetical protein